jgi:hypothetical protein
MSDDGERPSTKPKHLLTSEQLAAHAGATPDDVTQGHRRGNGARVHRTYILVVSVVALLLLIGAVAIASATM